MKKSWLWVLVILTGSLAVGSGLQYYFSGEPYRNTPARNWLVVGQVIVGLVIIGFGLMKQIQANRKLAETQHVEYKITD
ncbi:MAG: hypothetical protein JO053_04200 [Acidobacteria bacterium]|nr:hypothetical protein [Acidobacteriota bacterium]